MNKAQLKSVYKVMEINKPVGKAYGSSKELQDVYKIGDTIFYFGGTSYLYAKNIPIEVAEIIYNKYKDNKYQIRVAGGRDDWNPKDYENAGFLPLYHIDTYEGVIIFLSELKDYYLRKEGLEETYVKEYDKLLAKVTDDILKKSYPHITSHEWMQSDELHKEGYNLVNRRDLKNRSVTELKKALYDFEKAVNPYETIDGSFDKSVDYLKLIRVSALPYDFEGKTLRRDNCLELTIQDINNSDNYVFSRRDIDGFGYLLDYTFPNNINIKAIYQYGIQDSGKYGEYVSFERYDQDNDKTIIKYEFKITDKIIEYTVAGQESIYGKKDYVAMYNLTRRITDEIKYATFLASTITLDNMRKKGASRKRQQYV